MPALDDVLSEKIGKLKESKRFRSLVTATPAQGVRIKVEGKEYVSFASNDYLGLASHPDVVLAAAAVEGQHGAGASRLVTGNHPAYGALEAALAEAKGKEAALVFGSGYLANLGVIQALAGRGDAIFADKLIHACMLDGARLSGAELFRYPHNDYAALENLLHKHRGQFRHAWIVTETIFSMDGDRADIPRLRGLADVHEAWAYADDAHGLGDEDASALDVYIGTLSKSFGGYGGYVAGSRTLIDYITTTARPLIFATGLPANTMAGNLAALKAMQEEPWRRQRVMERARQFCAEMGLAAPESVIVPLVLGSEDAVLKAHAFLKERGFWVSAIRPPTVPEGTARLRFSFSALHSEAEVSALAKAVRECVA